MKKIKLKAIDTFLIISSLVIIAVSLWINKQTQNEWEALIWMLKSYALVLGIYLAVNFFNKKKKEVKKNG